MRLPSGSGDVLDERAVGLAEDRVVGAEEAEERLLPAPQRRPRRSVGRHGRVRRVGRHEPGERAGSGFVASRRERRGIAPHHGLRHLGDRRRLHDQAGGEDRRVAGERAPRLEGQGHATLGGRQEAVAHHDPAEPLVLLGGDPQPDERAPVLDERGDVGQVERVDPGRDPFDVAEVGVVLDPRRLVGFSEADQVGHEHPVPRGDQQRDHGAVEVAPRRLAVQQDDRPPVRRPLVHVVHPQRLGVRRRHVDVARCEVPTRQLVEAVLGRAQGLHAASVGLGSALVSPPAPPSRSTRPSRAARRRHQHGRP